MHVHFEAAVILTVDEQTGEVTHAVVQTPMDSLSTDDNAYVLTSCQRFEHEFESDEARAEFLDSVSRQMWPDPEFVG